MVRAQIQELLNLGRFPASSDAIPEVIKRQEDLLRSIRPPVSDEEAGALTRLFGPDDYFGGAWTVLHLIESAPGWPIRECIEGDENEWITRLRESARRAGKL